jgi:hypothetical protein
LLLIVHREAVEAYKPGDHVNINFSGGKIIVGSSTFSLEPLQDKLRQIINMKGLVNYMKTI